MVDRRVKRETNDLGCMHGIGMHAKARNTVDLRYLAIYRLLRQILRNHASLAIAGRRSAADVIPIVVRIQSDVENTLIQGGAVGSTMGGFAIELRPLGRAGHRIADGVTIEILDEIQAPGFAERCALLAIAIVELAQGETG